MSPSALLYFGSAALRIVYRSAQGLAVSIHTIDVAQWQNDANQEICEGLFRSLWESTALIYVLQWGGRRSTRDWDGWQSAGWLVAHLTRDAGQPPPSVWASSPSIVKWGGGTRRRSRPDRLPAKFTAWEERTARAWGPGGNLLHDSLPDEEAAAADQEREGRRSHLPWQLSESDHRLFYRFYLHKQRWTVYWSAFFGEQGFTSYSPRAGTVSCSSSLLQNLPGVQYMIRAQYLHACTCVC